MPLGRAPRVILRSQLSVAGGQDGVEKALLGKSERGTKTNSFNKCYVPVFSHSVRSDSPIFLR